MAVNLYISLPMKGVSREQINAERERIAHLAEIKLDTFVQLITQQSLSICEGVIGDFRNKPVYWLGDSISSMSEADYIVLGRGWENARGCRIEHAVAEEYGIKILNLE